STGNTFNINVPAGQNLPANTTINGGSAGKDMLAANWDKDLNGTLNVLGFVTPTATVHGAIAGTLHVSGDLTSLIVGRANTPTTGGVNDVTGQVIVGGSLTTASVSGNVSG